MLEPPETPADLQLVAYLVDGDADVVLSPNRPKREWIDRDTDGNGYRCLPLNIASSLGWSLLCPFSFEIEYDGRHLFARSPDRDAEPSRLVTDQFGGGVFTFFVSCLFRTPPEHNLFVTGPLNAPRRGASPLSAIIETDWLEATFTMNWKVTELDYPVTFKKGDPFCTFFPYPRNYVESFDPVLRDRSELGAASRRYGTWLEDRLTTLQYDGSYTRGEHFVKAGRGPIAGHQRALTPREFRDERAGKKRG